MELPLSPRSASVFATLGVTHSDELLNCLSGNDFEIFIPDDKCIKEYPEIKEHEQDVIRKTQAAVSIRYVNDVLGYGVFAKKPIEAGSMIGEYTGKLYGFSQLAHKPLQDLKYCISLGAFGIDYACGILYELYIDANERGNFTRFINHSSQPNILQKVVFANGLWHRIFIAKRKIEKDEQLSIDYGPDYWKDRKITPIDL